MTFLPTECQQMISNPDRYYHLAVSRMILSKMVVGEGKREEHGKNNTCESTSNRRRSKRENEKRSEPLV
jgi:hypothetical protein